MSRCPNCGGTVEEVDAVCPHCGASLDGRGDEADGRRRPDQHGGATGRAAGTGSPRQEQPPDVEGRRDLLKYGIGAAGVGGIGWLLLNDDSGQPKSPLDAGGEVEDYPQLAASFSPDYDADELAVTVDSVQKADTMTIDATDCAGVSGEVVISPPRAGDSETISIDDGTTCEVVVTATYEGNTVVLQKFEYDDG